MWKKYNPNPCKKSVGDCAVRAVAVALDLSWMDAFRELCIEAFEQCDMPSSDAVWGAVLRKKGFRRYVVSNASPTCYTAEDFLIDHPHGIVTLAFGGHVASAIDGVLYDSWDSSHECPTYFYFREA